ncbi:C69 family dipeptidase, partial [Myxococcota bacterium]|nr:C69 family dipeptidase [Myxococcota bacterium]
MKFLLPLLLFSLSHMLFAPVLSSESSACTSFLITKGASADNSTMITYAADSHELYGELYYRPAGTFKKGTLMDVKEWDTGKFIGKIPQALQTYVVVGNMNEHQVSISETTFGGRKELVDPKGGIDYGSLIYVALQRSKTAREAIKTMGALANEHGYMSSGESFSIADANEVWIMELIGKGPKEKGA